MRAAVTLVPAALLGVPGPAQASGDVPDPTARAYLPGCRVLLEDGDLSGSEEAGSCAGVIDALLHVGELLPGDYRSWVPLGVPRREIVRSIVAEIEAMSSVAERQDLKGVALDILRFGWPRRADRD